jgi:hypothetical protein
MVGGKRQAGTNPTNENRVVAARLELEARKSLACSHKIELDGFGLDGLIKCLGAFSATVF